MKVLGIETSCDDTAIAVVEDRSRVLASIVSSQTAIHRAYGGVVPELASRHHLENIEPIFDQALAEAGVGLAGIDAVAITAGPGLIGSLLVGVSFAKALAWAAGKPLVAVNHLEGHVRAAFIESPDLPLPALALIVSGGHSSLYLCPEEGVYRLIARTRDDAAGEAFDKAARLLGLGYPGGPVIDRLAKEGNPKAVPFPRARMSDGSLDFSFSGLKTALLRHARATGLAVERSAPAPAYDPHGPERGPVEEDDAATQAEARTGGGTSGGAGAGAGTVTGTGGEAGARAGSEVVRGLGKGTRAAGGEGGGPVDGRGAVARGAAGSGVRTGAGSGRGSAGDPPQAAGSGVTSGTATGAASGAARPVTAEVRDVAASFQRAVVDVLVERTLEAAEREAVASVIVSGGVACNSLLRAEMRARGAERGLAVAIPSPRYCTDNAAMIAAAGFLRLERGELAPADLTAIPGWRLGGPEAERTSHRHK